jgi:hypothetical protein
MQGWQSLASVPFVYDDATTYTGGGPLEADLNLDFLHEHERLPSYRFPMMV